MRKVLIAIGVILLAWAGMETYLWYASRQVDKEIQEVVRPKRNAVVSHPIVPKSHQVNLVYPQTTAQLEALLTPFDRGAVPRVFVGAFPTDFAQKGTAALFAKTILPLVLLENETLADERAKLLPIAHKVFAQETLTFDEEQYFNYLKTKYDVVEVGPQKQMNQLVMRVDRISPALAVAQALEATKDGKDLTSLFNISKWNENDQFALVSYPTLQAAVSDYALHLNSVLPYARFWELRRLNSHFKQPLVGRVFLGGLNEYQYNDSGYAKRVEKIYMQYQLGNLDAAQLQKEENK